jgi:uncharacterized protein YprB with RNaseH-like and TPR domain
MLSPDLRRKLSKLHTIRPADVSPEIPEMRNPQSSSAEASADRSAIRDLEGVLPGRALARDLGCLYVVEREIEELYPSGSGGIMSSVEMLGQLGVGPEEALFLDIETCGLANCPLFLVGTMFAREGGIRVEQFFARDYSEEPALLAHLAEIMARYRMLVTFNGKSFDIPYMRDRMTFHRMSHGFEHEHLDLLLEARRLWRGEFPDCRLQTLEEHVCGRRRYGDTPGHLIPQLYHDYVRTGNAAPLEGIFHHNALDIITMAELLPSILGRGMEDG